ncbi:MAG TPA: hypothetical protein VKA98_02420 [Nitrososphaeraceae archaeon]|nr:hypothetical protein [Nitrososphaeraceae archaeon]
MSKDKELSSARKNESICDNCGKSFSTIEEFPTHYKMILVDHSNTLVCMLDSSYQSYRMSEFCSVMSITGGGGKIKHILISYLWGIK